MALVRLDRKRLLVAARHTQRGVVWMEMPQLLGLSYQVILPSKRRRILLANCPQEAECVNSQVMPCNAVPSGWPLAVSVLRHTSWNAAVLAFGMLPTATIL